MDIQQIGTASAAGLCFGGLNVLLYHTSMRERWFFQCRDLRIARLFPWNIGGIAFSWLLSLYGAWVFGTGSLQYPGFLLLSNLLLLMSATDWKERVIPDKSLLAYLLPTAAYHLYVMDPAFTLNRLLGALAAGGVFGLAYLLRKDSVGLGDLKLIALCGLINGFPGVMNFLFRSLVFSALYSCYRLIRRKSGLKSEIPFAPFLFLGAIL